MERGGKGRGSGGGVERLRESRLGPKPRARAERKKLLILLPTSTRPYYLLLFYY